MCVLFGVGNNVSFFEMARRMQVFSMFLLYATSMMYTSVYGLWALFNAWTDKTRTRPIKDVMLDFSNHGIVSRAFVFLFYSAYSAFYSTLSLASASSSTACSPKCPTHTSTATSKACSIRSDIRS